MRKLVIGVIGAGNIAEKAYLPVYASLQDRVDFIVSSRKLETAEKIREQYNFSQAIEGIEPLFSGVDAVMIHAKTSVHFALCEKFLQRGISVFVDKPISEKLEEVYALKRLAKKTDSLFMTGFNRRFSPFIKELKEIPEKNMIFVSKNRINKPANPQFVLNDLFIHPLDTAIFLMDEPIEKVRSKVIHDASGQLIRAMVRMESKATTALVTMNLLSGANTETAEVQSMHGTYRCENLSNLVCNEGEHVRVKTFSDWCTTLEKRGFDPMVKEFFQALVYRQTGELSQEKILENLRQENIVKSHEIIAGMY